MDLSIIDEKSPVAIKKQEISEFWIFWFSLNDFEIITAFFTDALLK